MSLYDFEQLSPHELVLNYLIEVRGQGFFFSPSDLKFIDQWLGICPSYEELLVILADEAEAYFDKSHTKTRNPKKSLYGLNKIVLRKIKERSFLGLRTDTPEEAAPQTCQGAEEESTHGTR